MSPPEEDPSAESQTPNADCNGCNIVEVEGRKSRQRPGRRASTGRRRRRCSSTHGRAPKWLATPERDAPNVDRRAGPLMGIEVVV